MEPPWLKAKGATWWHSDDHASPNLSKASMGNFFHHVLLTGAYIGEIWVFNHRYERSAVFVTVFMTESMKEEIESKTRYKFRPPPVISLNSTPPCSCSQEHIDQVNNNGVCGKGGCPWGGDL